MIPTFTSVPKDAVIVRDQDCPYYKATFRAAGEHHAYTLTVAARTRIGFAHQVTECHSGQIIAIQNGAQVGETIKMTCATTQGVLTLDLPGDYTIDISLTDTATNTYTLKLADVTNPTTQSAEAWPPSPRCTQIPPRLTSVPKTAVIVRDQDCPYYKATFGAAGEHHAYTLTVAARTRIGFAHQVTECHSGQIIAIQNGAQVGETIKMNCATTQGVLTLDLPGEYTIDISLTDTATNTYTLKLADVTNPTTQSAEAWPPSPRCTHPPPKLNTVPKSAAIGRDQDCPYYKATFGAAGEHHAYTLTVATRTRIGIAHQVTECRSGQIIAIQNGAQVGETIKMTCSTTQGVLTLDLPGDYTIDISLNDPTTNSYTLKLTDVT